ncbi:gpre46 combination endonuclease [Synechococcus phage ACG-2014f]|uniref:Gpre46 combination endonuclease n=3 Tax=Atlauavirus TaxID=2733092 RepID=A0A0E3I207_9CAUD|nr:SbcC-like subunit of palindrome specific endonuclease [Synechococcus phage ACG-2014f_Syn7803C8]YP_009778869.1 SbcC-like subunit of palindrome specific endonuclease [Synechococcus phage ACG-2014f_Syn7803US26]AIX16671.1 gpre46 combination endonuclease [Synechococcus phage ACG-2014f]AIX18449.1 gpre46 combination endonuclease [Synechococcus phage ACG-2014f]AIX20327.1 gpre46 combination endonuclease [Synechococcus phage ACG-2014f]AIX21475.1 gpre46 combination endonuclease [Synechococcus phage AC
MLLFKKLRWQNFLSTGDKGIEVDFLMNNTNLIIGSNGAGKSTLLDALTFVLFNKPFRKITKPQLVNSITEKRCVVEIEFETNNKSYLVRRGIKPNVFDIVVDGKLLDKRGDDRDNQKLLEENILKVNYKSFTQVIILGASTFVPFMQLTASNRRDVIEDLLDIRVFSQMSGIVKDRIRQLREDIKILDLKRGSLRDKSEMQKNFINEITKKGESNIESKGEKIKTLLFEKQTLETENITTLTKLKELQDELEGLEDASDKLRKLGSLRGKISQKITTLTKEHKFFKDNASCPTCTQDIDEEFRSVRLSELGDKAKEMNKGFKELEDTIEREENRENEFKSISKQILELNTQVSTNNTKNTSISMNIGDLESEIGSIRHSIDNQTEEKEKLDRFQDDLSRVFDTLSTRNSEMDNNKFVYELLKDGGVKTNIIRKYIPFINKQVNRYLQMMEFYINFELDEEFNETVVSPIHENFSYSSFSEGEKMRIDLALLFTWREVARVRNSVNTNLLIMDEVFDSSLDGFGTEEFLKIIRYVVQDANVFIISHKQELHERFDSVLRFEKDRGFSKLTLNKTND